MKHSLLKSIFSLAAAVGLWAGSAQATVEYAVTHNGGVSYTYDYTVTNDTLVDALLDIVIDFDETLYDELTLTASATPAGWTAIPLFSLPPFAPAGMELCYGPCDGTGAGLAVGSSLDFSVTFDWLDAPNLPAEQPFTIFDLVTYNELDSGMTVPKKQDPGPGPGTGVPAPGTIALLALGMGLLGGAARRRMK